MSLGVDLLPNSMIFDLPISINTKTIMTIRINLTRIFRSIAVIATIILGALIINLNYVDTALAADNYSAATDTYQETRNLNRVNSTPEELAKSKLDRPEETEGKSIYDRVVERVDNQRNEVLKEGDKSTKSSR